MHHVNGAIFLSIGVGLIVVSRRFAGDLRWRGLAAYTLATGIVVVVLDPLNGLLAGPGAPLYPWAGLLQRATLAVWLPCVVILALRLRRVAAPQPTSRAPGLRCLLTPGRHAGRRCSGASAASRWWWPAPFSTSSGRHGRALIAMTMTPRLRKLALTTHVTCSVGWLGAVAAFLALAIVGLTSQDAATAREVYPAMAPIGRFVLVPLSLACLLTGLIQALGTAWGLFRHYWVMFKLLINLVATILLLVHVQVASQVAAAASQASLSSGDLIGMMIQLLADTSAALLVLLVAVTLSVYKPKGLTRYGWRTQHQQREQPAGPRPVGTSPPTYQPANQQRPAAACRPCCGTPSACRRPRRTGP